MNIWLAIFLFLHVMGAIIAFGPVFSFPIIGAMGGKEPQHANFATRVGSAISEQRVFPLAVFQGVTGVGLILVTGANLLATHWLLVGIALYLIVLGYNMFVQTPTVKKIIAMTSTPPPPDASGPPPELLAAIRKVQRGGMFSAVMIVLIVILMVTKPLF
ncbi:MAG TPA: DUF2269 family protein [Candidatus Limnocylindrales bacterium]|nr:DUF2269 family protein [Candidatus Limnocylindrales bacterium]